MSATRPLVAVLLGTDHHRFDRLVEWVDAEAESGDAAWQVQHGTSVAPQQVPSSSMLSITELTDLLNRADAVVTHAGPGLIMEARAAGHTPIVVPRDPALAEHVDDHQLRFAARIAEEGLIRLATNPEEFCLAVKSAVADGRQRVDAEASETGFATRFAALVDDLVTET